MLEFSCDTKVSGRQILPSWKHTAGSGHAALALRHDWRKQLKKCHQELGFEHVRFHGILSAPMDTLTIQMDQPLYSFFNANSIMDYLREIGMRPFVELSFMPRALSSGDKTVFKYQANVTPPRDYTDWATLIDKLVRNWVDRYGLNEVRQWYFEVWNEPNLENFWTGGREKYFQLYRVTVETLKNIDASLHVGGPATAANAWIPEFVEFCETNHLPADFISTHQYPTDAFGEPGDDTETQLAKSKRSIMRDHVREVVKNAAGKPVYYTEWNTSSNPRDTLHDQPFAAAFVVKTLMEVCEYVQGYSFWTFSDIFEENYFPSKPFHGGFGLLNLYGIPKPIYRAYELLSQLGTEKLEVQGSHGTVDAWAWRGENSVQLVLTNHALPRHSIESHEVQFTLRHFAPPKSAWVARIDEDHANPRRLWQAMGEPEYLKPYQVERLIEASSVTPTPQSWKQQNEDIVLHVSLPPHAVAMVTLE
jgi:xylan 1,4-beta-xylosidase